MDVHSLRLLYFFTVLSKFYGKIEHAHWENRYEQGIWYISQT